MVLDLMHVHHCHGRMVNGVKMIFSGVDNSSSKHADNREIEKN